MDQGSVFDNTEYVRDGGDHDPCHSRREGSVPKSAEEISVCPVACGGAPACVPVGAGERDEPVQT